MTKQRARRKGWRRWVWWGAVTVITVFVIALALSGCVAARIMWMPGSSYTGPLPPLTTEQRQTRDAVEHHVRELSQTIGERNRLAWDQYLAAQAYIQDQFRATGCDEVAIRGAWRKAKDLQPVGNVEATVRGTGDEIIVIGAHYDTVLACPGADDNASGVAATLELARLYAAHVQQHGRPARTVRFVAFFNEEFWGAGPWGSLGYARDCRDRGDHIVGMMSLEMLGYYSDAPNSQKYPRPFSWFYPSVGNFIGFIGNDTSGPWVRQVIGAFRATTKFPSKGAAVPPSVADAGRSDHSAFWRYGYPGLMVTDTANFRNPNYHRPSDTADTLDYDRLARVTCGLERVLERLEPPSAAQASHVR